jgi:hypothetical protein
MATAVPAASVPKVWRYRLLLCDGRRSQHDPRRDCDEGAYFLRVRKFERTGLLDHLASSPICESLCTPRGQLALPETARAFGYC